MTPAIKQRLKDGVPAFKNRVFGAASLAMLTAAEAVPNVTPCAHVIPSGLLARSKPLVTTGGYVQSIERGYAVFLSLRLHDPNGEQALDEVETLIEGIVAALVGWTPDPRTVGTFILKHSVLRSFERGTAIYEISFSIADQLRIAT